MKIIHPFYLIAVAALFTSGCLVTQDPSTPPPASQAEVQYLREELRRMNDRLNSSEYQLSSVQQNVASSQASQGAYASAAQVQSLQEQLAALQKQIRAVDDARAKDKQAIYDDITKKVTALMKTSAPQPRAQRSQTGYSHVVQPGESLSKIAAAYGVKMSVIMTENKLKNADNIFIGQELFIPD